MGDKGVCSLPHVTCLQACLGGVLLKSETGVSTKGPTASGQELISVTIERDVGGDDAVCVVILYARYV